jgi:hypothetical protein
MNTTSRQFQKPTCAACKKLIEDHTEGVVLVVERNADERVVSYPAHIRCQGQVRYLYARSGKVTDEPLQRHAIADGQLTADEYNGPPPPPSRPGLSDEDEEDEEPFTEPPSDEPEA